MAEEQEEVTVGEILEGLVNPNFISQRLPLLEMLTNKLAEETTTIDKDTAEKMFKILLTILQKTSCQHPMGRKVVNMANCTLSNATVKEEAVGWFLDLTSVAESDTYKQLHFCINKFLDYNPQLEDDTTEGEAWVLVDEWQQFGNAFCNLCQTDQGRQLLLKQSLGYMEKMVKQIRSKNATRRRGSIGCIRSCLFDQDIHWWMLYDIKVLTPILLPLVVPTPFTDREREKLEPVLWMAGDDPDKKFEPELDIMKMLLECIILLCQRRGLREEMRKRGAYFVVKNLDLKTEDEGVSGAIYEIVNFLMGDEDPDTPIDTYQVPAITNE